MVYKVRLIYGTIYKVWLVYGIYKVKLVYGFYVEVSIWYLR